ncbi:hypothetical protein GCM10009736_80540 [Actinomadura bangladeshensis]
MTSFGQRRLGRTVHQRVRMVARAVEFGEFALEVAAHRPHDLFQKLQWSSVKSRNLVTKTTWPCGMHTAPACP